MIDVGVKMTSEQAKQALKKGKKVTSLSWNKNTFIELQIRDESGEQHGYDIFEDNKFEEWIVVEDDIPITELFGKL